MTRLTAQDFDQELLILFDAYVHGDVDRRGFLEKAQRYAKAGVTAAACSPRSAPISPRASRSPRPMRA
jgi:carboxymethylenebutenolidase